MMLYARPSRLCLLPIRMLWHVEYWFLRHQPERLLAKFTSPTILWSTLRKALPSPSFSFIATSHGTNPKCLLNSLNDHLVSISSASPSLSSLMCSYLLSTTLSLPPAEWCEKALASMTCSPATGINNISSYSLKVSWSIISSSLVSILNSSISTSTFPLSWKCRYIRPLKKVGIGTVLTTENSHSQSYQHVENSWKSMSRRISQPSRIH